MDAVLTRRSQVAPQHRRRQAAVGGGRHRHRRPVRRRGPDHRHRRRARLARRPGPPRLGQRAQDPAGLRRRGRHGRDLRHAARRRRAGHRAAAVRVLAACVHPARRGDERRRRRARRALRRRSAVRRARPRLRRPRPAPAVRAPRRGAAACSPWSSRGACSSSRTCSAGCPFGVAWHPIVGAAVWASLGLLVPRALGVGYDVIDDALAGRLAMATLATLAIGKLVIWWIALASGTSGGTLAPILLISSCSGALVGELLARGVPAPGHLTVRLRPRGHGGHVRRRRPRAVRGDRVPLRADPRLQRDAPADAGDRAGRPRRPHARSPTAS